MENHCISSCTYVVDLYNYDKNNENNNNNDNIKNLLYFSKFCKHIVCLSVCVATDFYLYI